MSKEHGNGCNVLGRYCWTHKVKTEAGIPGWTRPLKGPGTGYGAWDSNEYGGYTHVITWKNGDQESRRGINKEGIKNGCFVCHKNCANPVSFGVTGKYDGYSTRNKANLT